MRSKNIWDKLRQEDGVTLIELIIALGLFALVMIMVTESFTKVLGGERAALASKYIQENMRNVLDTMSREMRSAAATSTAGCCAATTVFCTSSASNLIFANSAGQCVTYSLRQDGAIQRLQVQRGWPSGSGPIADLTSNKINIKIFWAGLNPVASSTQLATVFFEAQAAGNNTDNQDTLIEMSIKAR